MKNSLPALCALFFTTFAILANGQNAEIADIQNRLKDSGTNYAPADYQNLVLTDYFKSEKHGITYLYAAQSVNGLRIANSSLSAAFDANGKLRSLSERFFRNISQKANGASPEVELSAAIVSQLYDEISGLEISENPGTSKVTISGTNFNHDTEIELVYYAMPEGNLKLSWSFDCALPSQKHWYHYFVDAHSGALLKKIDWQVECGIPASSQVHSAADKQATAPAEMLLSPNDGSGYRVFEFPVESPNHGSRTLVTEPGIAAASPFGWHDINGVEGADYQITRGNNVYAYEDENDQDFPGGAPLGGPDLLFDYPYDPDQIPEMYQLAAITNLFYANNRIHDILFQYGFDEVSGNFQSKNYSGNGQENDAVRAEAQDGGGSNNANFATPPDGSQPRMQMYLWQSGSFDNLLVVNDPSSISGGYFSSSIAGFGPGVPTDGITADIALADDDVLPDVNDGCETITNDLTGKIAILYRGSCTFVQKVSSAEAAGAVACIVINDEGDGVIDMGGTDNSIGIPSLMIGLGDGNTIVDEIENGNTVNATFNGDVTLSVKDGSFDNGIVTHEYCHGVSIRLTGGSSTSDCLNNDEQMGEGWSDWYAIMLTMDMDAEDPAHRPMGTFASGDPVNGNGIRPVPYDTNMVANSYTYGDLGNGEISVPHGVGFIWSTMLWDLSWAFINEYGYDPDIDNGTGGNNMVMHLITEALKLQVCEPGFVDGRDAIIMADELINDGENKCMIWKVFARRGLGFSADQGSSQSRTDGTESFDIPNICLPSIEAPVAQFSSNVTQTCNGIVQFTDESENTPQTWSWDFGDGAESGEQNPQHIYQDEGVYTVSLLVTNQLGVDSVTQTDLIVYSEPGAPEATGAVGCSGDTVTLSAQTPDGTIRWTNAEGDIEGEENTLNITLDENSETFYAQTVILSSAPVFVGPDDTNIGGGGNHATDFTGTVDFTTFNALTINTADVVSGATGQRVISLWSGSGGSGQLLDQAVVDIDFTGSGTIDLGFEINEPGDYSIGLNQADLYRNDSGVDYPYEAPGLMTITGSSAGSEYYYYFYNLEIAEAPCLSDPVAVQAEWLGNADFTTSVSETDLNVGFSSEAVNATSWLWDFGDGETSEEENPTHEYAQSGTYTVTLTTNTGCSSSQVIDVGTVGIDFYQNGEISILPNPANDHIEIKIESQQIKAEKLIFYDVQGRVVQTAKLDKNTTNSIFIGSLPAGIYMVSVVNADENPVHRQRLLIMH